jgi:hypothetical protein
MRKGEKYLEKYFQINEKNQGIIEKNITIVDSK